MWWKIFLIFFTISCYPQNWVQFCCFCSSLFQTSSTLQWSKNNMLAYKVMLTLSSSSQTWKVQLQNHKAFFHIAKVMKKYFYKCNRLSFFQNALKFHVQKMMQFNLCSNDILKQLFIENMWFFNWTFQTFKKNTESQVKQKERLRW